MRETKRKHLCALIAALQTKPTTAPDLAVLSGFHENTARQWLRDLQAAKLADVAGQAEQDGCGAAPQLWAWGRTSIPRGLARTPAQEAQ